MFSDAKAEAMPLTEANKTVIVLREHRILIYCVTKVAASSIKAAVLKALGLIGSDVPDLKLIHHHPDLKMAFPYETENSDYLKVGIVRNPAARLVSCWADKVNRTNIGPNLQRYGFKPHMPFDEFIDTVCRNIRADVHFYPQSEMIGKHMDFVGRFENLENAWREIRRLCQHKGLQLDELPKLNSSQHVDWQSYYDRRLSVLIRSHYHEDFIRFGYLG